MPSGWSNFSSGHVSPNRARFWVVANTGIFSSWPGSWLVASKVVLAGTYDMGRRNMVVDNVARNGTIQQIIRDT